MSRKSLYICVTCLLYLLPALSFAQSLTLYEYWFDDDFDNRISSSLSGANAVVNTSIDANQLDNGIHKFSFRAKQSDGKYSAVSSSLFLKRTAAQGSQVEYWFDDNFDQRDSLDILNTEEEQELSLDLRSNTKYPMGFHKLNMRVTLEGEGESAIFSSDVVKLSAGKATRLEYWIDDDIAHSQTIEGKPSTDGTRYQFLSDLDFSGVSPGYHRLYCRSVSTSKITSGAVSMTPIMVKPKDYGKVTIEKYSVAIDNEEPIMLNVKKPDIEVGIPYTLHARGLDAEKQHRIDLAFYNSIGKTVSTTGVFTVNTTKDPVIRLTAKEENGFIKLQFNSIPNDAKYNIYRKIGGDGIEVCLPVYNNNNYPNTCYYSDAPMAGTYEYVVEGFWNDYNGIEHSVRSNILSITANGTHGSEQYGSIEGIIRIKDEQMAHLPSDLVLDVNFSDGVKVRVQENGTFYRNDVPLETTLTMTLSDYSEGELAQESSFQMDYIFDEQTATVTKEQPIAHVVFNGERNDKSDKTDDFGYSELAISSSLRCTDNSFTFDVQNISGRTWTGVVYLKAVSCKEMKKYDEEGFKIGSSISFGDLKSAFDLGSQPVYQLANGKHQELTINFNNLPYLPNDEDYYIYIVSGESGSSRCQVLKSTQEDVSNPKLWTLLANVSHFDNAAMMQEVIDECLKEIYEDMDIFKKIDGPFKFALEEAASELNRISRDKYGTNNAFGNLPELLTAFGTDFKNAVKDVDDAVQIVKQFQSFCNKIKRAEEIRQIGNENSYKKWNEAMKLIFSLYEYADGPLAGIYMLYLDATTKAVDFIDKNFENLFEFCRPNEFVNDKITFRIAVRKKSHIPILENAHFTAGDIYTRIRDIDVYCLTPGEQHCKLEGDLESNKNDGRQLVLKTKEWPRRATNGNELDGSKAKEFWMEIYWWNGRVTKIPLMEGIVDISNSQTNPVITINLQSGSNSASTMDNKISIIYKNPDLNEKK